MRIAFRLSASALLLLAACSGDGRSAGASAHEGTLVMSSPADADNLLPPLTINEIASQVGALMFEKLVEPGDSLNTVGDAGFQPSLADSWSWAPDSLSIAFHLDPKAHWHDGVPVRAADVVYSYRINVSHDVGSPVGPMLASIDSVTARDSLTPVFWFHERSPEQFFNAGSQIRILPAHLLQATPDSALKTSPFGRHPVGSGPYRFGRWVPGSTIELDADTAFHRGRPKLARLIWSITLSPDAAILRLFSGEANFTDYLRPQDVAQVAKHPELKAVRYPTMLVYFLLFNERATNGRGPSVIFADREVRRALTMAVDRRRAVNTVLDTVVKVALGPISSALSTYDANLPRLPYAPDSARAMLARRGWVLGADSVRRKGGVPLRFTILVPSTSVVRQQMAVVLQDMFRQVGARVVIEQLDFASFGARQQAHTFDAALVGMSLDPSPANIRQEWSSAAARASGTSNPGNYQSMQFDAYVDSASRQMNPALARAYYQRAYATIIEDAPAVWLYEGSNVAGMRVLVHPAPMRADAWFVHLADWTVGGDARAAGTRVATAASTH
jgi:peptide/nickel transport system substrate-binding protein